MQKAFPKVLAAVLCVIAYGVALVIALTGTGHTSEKLWVVVIAVPPLLLFFVLRNRWQRKRRGNRPSSE